MAAEMVMETETETIGNCRHRRRPRHHTHMALACIGLQRISKTASIVFTAHRTAGLIRRKRTMRHRPETSGGAKSAASPRLCESSMVRK